MGLFDFIDDIFSTDDGGSFLGDLAGGFFSGIFDGGSRATQVSYLPGYSFPESFPQPMVRTAAPPLVARAVAAGLPSWSARFPALWQALQRLRASGAKVTVEQLRSMLKKWGPAALTAYIGGSAVADLMTYDATRKRRRINPANARALRRSMRRLKSFDRLSHRVSMQLSRTCRTRRVHRVSKTCS
jgi:hypothetical protein